jgi:HPt (histidine-containing phosphotransfer) domain-containing protein
MQDRIQNSGDKRQLSDSDHKAIDSLTDQIDEISRILYDPDAPSEMSDDGRRTMDEERNTQYDIRNTHCEDVVDWKQLIGRIVDEELVAEIMPVCVEDNRERLKMLAVAVWEAESENVKGYAHAIKGSAANLGAKRLSELALRLEHMASLGDLSEARQLLEAMETEFQRFAAFVSQPDWMEIAKRNSV